MAAPNVPGLVSPGNVDLAKRPVVKNQDGSISTVRSMSFNEDGKEILVPTVSPDGRIMSDDEAIDFYHKTGQNLGVFASPDAATKYAETLHNQQDGMYSKPGRVSFDDLIAGATPAGPPKTGEDLRSMIYSQLEAQRAAAKPAPHPPRDTGNQKADFGSIYTDDMLFGLPGKAAAGMNALIRAPFTDKSVGEEYNTIRDQYQNARANYKEEHPTANATASIAGAIHGGGTVNRLAGVAAESALPRVAQAVNNSYLGRVAADAASGAAQGALSAYGHDENLGLPTLIGGVVGGAARPVTSLVGGTASAIGSMMGLGNNTRAQNAIAQALMRSRQSADDVYNDMSRAVQQGQPEYVVADALGNPGQRMLTGIVRSPGDERGQIVEQLQRRQAGQGRRIQNALVEGFGTPQTRQQTEAALTALRRAEADVNYPAARAAAGTVDPTGAIGRADEFLGTAGSLPRTNIANDSVEGAVNRARSLLTDGNNVISDFDTAFRAKVELDSMIENGNPTIQGRLRPIRDELDRALERSSDLYRNARDTFRRQSQDIEAANVGRDASMRGRVEDTIPRFQAMTRPEQQQSFRAGYVDPLIETVQSTPGAMTNKARPLISDATQAEFPAFAVPGQAPQLMERIGREQRMFDTTRQALGGSDTAGIAADMAEIQGFDPSMISAFATGGIRGAAMHALQQGVNAIGGRNQGTRDMIARMLMQSDPTQARAALAAAVRKGETLTRAQQAIVNAIIGAGATAYSR